ncbi:glycerophosphodiester phosphodiesterase family protein [Pararoseomonas sp. SCSIO 73927]|uniref:glycerophosphodiester phosphodiesterase family protein n=1 Tax=Pararoseomonas sp. SCSIO 73927 TaxID=3114537 RepID=UPI0030CF70E9
MASYDTLDGQAPIVVSHRGASAVRPEHTIEAYRKAIELGSKFIEPDLVTTKDGVLVARHEHTLAGTTDIADHPEFADREWVIENFTLAELKTLRAIERTGDQRPESSSYNGQFEIATLDEIIALVKGHEAATGQKIAIVPELKSPSLLLAKGYDTAQMLVDALVANDFTDRGRVFVQSFESGNLKALHETIMPAAGVDFHIVQLGNTATPEGLAAIAEYADIVGPSINAILPRARLTAPVDGDGDGTAQITTRLTGQVTDLVANAHAVGLKVIPYTVRAEEPYLALNPDGTVQTAAQEIQKLIDAGVDGFFTDHTDIGLRAVKDDLTADGTRGGDELQGTAGTDYLYGGAGEDTISGGAGDDFLYAGADNDVVDGGAGNDRLVGDAGNDRLTGGEGHDRLIGGAGNDTLLGGAGDDTLIADAGSDLLVGGAGSNRLTGGEGADTFRFEAAAGRGNLTRLMDFASGEDRIELDGAVFTALEGEGQLLAESFGLGRTATTAEQHLLYDGATGDFLYDADGAGGAAAIRIGTLVAGTELSVGDIWVV